MERNKLAEQLELVGDILAVDGVAEVLAKLKPDDKIAKVNAYVIQISAKILHDAQDLADKLVANKKGVDVETLAAMEDKEYAKVLRECIMRDVLGFFA